MTTFLVGTGKADVTARGQGLKMQGWADSDQETSGAVDVEDRELLLYSRAFIVEEPESKKRVVIVVADIWSASRKVKAEVLARLRKDGDEYKVYTASNVLLSGTHTHSAPAGYTGYRLYDQTSKGIVPQVFDRIVSGIVDSIKQAHKNLAPGKIYLYEGEVKGCGGNRSPSAHDANFDVDKSARTDKGMLVLKFAHVERGKEQPIGLLSWYAIHPTDRGQQNRTISGDNKGYASFLSESLSGTLDGVKQPFVAAYANSNCGDVSGSVDDQYNNDKTRIRQHNDASDIASMKLHGQLQHSVAWELIKDDPKKKRLELEGGVDYRQKHVDMSNAEGEYSREEWEAMGRGQGPFRARTAQAALGLSFAAGSTEDGKANPNIGLWEGITVEDVLKDPILRGKLDLGKDALNAVFGKPLDAILEVVGGIGTFLMKLFSPTEMSKYLEASALAHYPKPIVLHVGTFDPPIAPSTLPLQLLKIGNLVITAIPGEITTMAGRRLRRTVEKELEDTRVKFVALHAYANDYSQYITTLEEYYKQHYEGASNLFGPHTLAAYRQEFRSLALELKSGPK